MQLPYQLSIFLKKLHDAGCGPIRQAGEEFRCHCPAHNDQGPSLYIRANEGQILNAAV